MADQEQTTPMTSPALTDLDEAIFTRLGAVSGIFMSKDQKGTEIIMPEKEITAEAYALKAEVKEVIKLMAADCKDLDEFQQRLAAA